MADFVLFIDSEPVHMIFKRCNFRTSTVVFDRNSKWHDLSSWALNDAQIGDAVPCASLGFICVNWKQKKEDDDDSSLQKRKRAGSSLGCPCHLKIKMYRRVIPQRYTGFILLVV